MGTGSQELVVVVVVVHGFGERNVYLRVRELLDILQRYRRLVLVQKLVGKVALMEKLLFELVQEEVKVRWHSGT